jgi:hypothetical protein
MHQLKLLFKIRRVLKSFENPTFLAKRTKWLYWMIYNFSWDGFYWIFDNKLAKSSVFASTVGYLIYLNDIVLENFGFSVIANSTESFFGIDTRSKLVMIYFGLILVAIGRLVYLWRRPHTLRFGPGLQTWVAYGLANFTFGEFQTLHQDIRVNGHRSTYGKYYDDDWDAFQEDACWADSGQGQNLGESKLLSRKGVHFGEAKSRHEDVLRSILIDRYFEYSARNKFGLFAALLTSLPGYLMFFVPNLDLFLTIAFSFLGS